MDRIRCPVCTAPVAVRATRSTRGKAALMLACPQDGRHFRAFINDAAFVAGVLARLAETGGGQASEGHRQREARGGSGRIANGRTEAARTAAATTPAAVPPPRSPARRRR